MSEIRGAVNSFNFLSVFICRNLSLSKQYCVWSRLSLQSKSMAKKMKKVVRDSPVSTRARKRTLEDLQAVGVNLDEVIAFVCNHLDCPVGRIVELVSKQFGLQLNREQPYEMLRRAAAAGRLLYIAPLDSDLAVRLL